MNTIIQKNESFWQTLPKPIVGLSPMDGVTDACFRKITAIHGQPDLTMTEFLNVDGICHGAASALRGLAFSDCERPVVAQLYGARPEPFFHVAQLVCELGFDGLDINMGCPTKKVAGHGSGAALIKDPKRALAIIETAKAGIREWVGGAPLSICTEFPKVADWFRHSRNIVLGKREGMRHAIPVSVKTRLGVDQIVIEDWIKQLLDAEPAAISLHGRTLRQGYRGEANWEEIGKAVEAANGSDTLILGNGDLNSMQDAAKRIRQTHVDGVLIGRAAIGNPWLFQNKSALRLSLNNPVPVEKPVSLNTRFSVLLEHARFYEKENGKTHFVGMRKHLASYCRGFPGARALRMKMIRAVDTGEVSFFLSNHLAGLASTQTTPSESDVLLTT